mgnify:CR=1 FL=1|jgi:hypothetical protein
MQKNNRRANRTYPLHGDCHYMLLIIFRELQSHHQPALRLCPKPNQEH